MENTAYALANKLQLISTAFWGRSEINGFKNISLKP